jgi:uncharacterized membrane protein YbaN (DUF454 family)
MSLRKLVWLSLGFLFTGIAYIGIFVPLLPTTTFALAAAFCFAKSSDRFQQWILNHKVFGKVIRNWNERKVYPTKAKYIMVSSMALSLLITAVFTHNWPLILIIAAVMAAIVIWAWRYPGTVEEFDRRKESNEKIGWLK